MMAPPEPVPPLTAKEEVVVAAVQFVRVMEDPTVPLDEDEAYRILKLAVDALGAKG